MKLIIAGGRDYQFTHHDLVRLDMVHRDCKVTEVVSGGASGADRDGEKWAQHRGIPVKQFPADWNKHGKAAGPIRNREMAEYADAVALFSGGRGTANMRRNAEFYQLKIFDFSGESK